VKGRKGPQSIKKWEAQKPHCTWFKVGARPVVCGAVRNKRGQRAQQRWRDVKFLNARGSQDEEHEGVEEVEEAGKSGPPNNADGRSREQQVLSMGSIETHEVERAAGVRAAAALICRCAGDSSVVLRLLFIPAVWYTYLVNQEV
jgi:hypothetical protein